MMVLKHARTIVAALTLTFAGAAVAQAQPQGQQQPEQQQPTEQQPKEQQPQQQQPQQQQQPTPEAQPGKQQAGNWGQALQTIRGENAMVLAAAKAAEKKGATREVRRFAKKVVKSREKFEKRIQKIAKREKVTLPPPRTPANAEEVRTKLEQAPRGTAFDRAFLDMMIEVSQRDMQRLERLGTAIQSPKVRKRVNELHKKVRKQLEEAQKLRSGIKTPESTKPGQPGAQEPSPLHE